MKDGGAGSGDHSGAWCARATWLFMVIVLILQVPLGAREKDKSDYGTGLLVDIPLPESEVSQVVGDVAQNGIIRGTKEYSQDEYIKGATALPSTPVFPPWTEGGKLFFKVRKQAIDPLNFKDSNDVGTLAVRYVVLAQGDKSTALRIDAIFVEEFRRASHLSNGSVETAEYKDIKDRLDAIEEMKAQTADAQKERQEQKAKSEQPAIAVEVPPVRPLQPTVEPTHDHSIPAIPAATVANEPSSQTLLEHVQDLRKQVERAIKAAGAPLKSAPFHTASTLKSLAPGAEVVILISTPYWYGVETRDGQHGWLLRDQLEPLP